MRGDAADPGDLGAASVVHAEVEDDVLRLRVADEKIRRGRASELAEAYERAWEDWERSGAAEAWDVVAADGLRRAAR